MLSQGVSLRCPSNDFSGLPRASIRVPSTVSITIRLGSKTARLSWPGKSTVRRSLRVSAVNTTFLRKSPLPLTNQIAPVIDAATLIAFTLFQRSRPPWALTAKFNRSLVAGSFTRTVCSTGRPSFGSKTIVAAFILSLLLRTSCSHLLCLVALLWVCELRIPAFRQTRRHLVLNDIPVLNEQPILEAEDVDDNLRNRLMSRVPAVNHHVVTFADDHSGLIIRVSRKLGCEVA